MVNHFIYGPLVNFRVKNVWKNKQRNGYIFTVELVFRDKTVSCYHSFKTKKEAERGRDIVVASLYAGEYVYRDDVKLKDFAPFWMREYCLKERKARTQTYLSYKTSLKSLILPVLGELKLNSISQADILSWFNDERVLNYGVNGVATAFSVIKGMLRYAKKNGYVAANVANNVRLPVSFRKKREAEENKQDAPPVLTPQQVIVLLLAARETNIYPLVLLAVTLGLRRSEIRGIKYEDFDFRQKTVVIRRQLSSVSIIDENRDLCEIGSNEDAPTKTGAGERVEKVADFVLEEIMLMRVGYEKNREKRKARGKRFVDGGYVLCSEAGKPRSSAFGAQTYKKLFEDNNLPYVTLHELRHTFATIASDSGVSLKAVSAALGHATLQVSADVYIEFVPTIPRGSVYVNDIVDELTTEERLPEAVINNAEYFDELYQELLED